jgi:hyperosmotically inducible protein
MNRKQTALHAAAVALIIGLIGSAGAASVPETDVKPLPNREFSTLDANRYGYLSKEEARKLRGFEKAFMEADENRDGRLDADEFAKALAINDRIRAGKYVEDSVITTKVKAALMKDRALSALAVSVETRLGTVLLSGFVDNQDQARRAAEVAARVQGVVEVKSNLTVKS